MTAPVIHSRNDFQLGPDADGSVTISLTNAPQSGGIAVVLVHIYTGTGGPFSYGISTSGGSGVSVTTRADDFPSAQSAFGVRIATIEYTTAPTSIAISSIDCLGDFYASGSILNITGQAASYFDVAGVSSGTGTTATATAMGDLTDATDLVLGIVGIEASGTTITPVANWSEVVEIDEGQATYVPANIVQRTPGSTGTYDPSWTIGTSSAWRAAGIAIKGTAGGGSIVPQAMANYRMRAA